MLASKIDTLFQKVDGLQPTPSHDGAPNGSFGQESICEVCGIQGHSGNKFHLSYLFQDLTVEHANALNNFNNRL